MSFGFNQEILLRADMHNLVIGRTEADSFGLTREAIASTAMRHSVRYKPEALPTQFQYLHRGELAVICADSAVLPNIIDNVYESGALSQETRGRIEVKNGRSRAVGVSVQPLPTGTYGTDAIEVRAKVPVSGELADERRRFRAAIGLPEHSGNELRIISRRIALVLTVDKEVVSAVENAARMWMPPAMVFTELELQPTNRSLAEKAILSRIT
jgi:hypothetical protein